MIARTVRVATDILRESCAEGARKVSLGATKWLVLYVGYCESLKHLDRESGEGRRANRNYYIPLTRVTPASGEFDATMN